MLQSQNRQCAICEELPAKEEGKKLHVDHCHATNKVRALLCFNCNRGLGCYKERKELFLKSIAYLERFS